jgi:hypothetical protein
MIKKRISVIAAIMAMAMATTSAMPAFAAETTEPAVSTLAVEEVKTPDEPVDPLPPAPIGICYETTVYGYYTTVTTAHNCNNRFYIGSLPYGYKVDIRMLNGSTVVWEESGAMTGNSNRTFWCGSNVTAVQARVTNWNGSGASGSYTFGVDTEV